MASIDDLVDQHGEETVRKAFWLQEQIYEEGIEAARFTDASESKMEQVGPMLVKQKIEQEFKKSI
jgi:hypothetical protein